MRRRQTGDCDSQALLKQLDRTAFV